MVTIKLVDVIKDKEQKKVHAYRKANTTNGKVYKRLCGQDGVTKTSEDLVERDLGNVDDLCSKCEDLS